MDSPFSNRADQAPRQKNSDGFLRTAGRLAPIIGTLLGHPTIGTAVGTGLTMLDQQQSPAVDPYMQAVQQKQRSGGF